MLRDISETIEKEFTFQFEIIYIYKQLQKWDKTVLFTFTQFPPKLELYITGI